MGVVVAMGVTALPVVLSISQAPRAVALSTASVAGTVWNDANGNGVLGTDEVGRAGAKVVLLGAGVDGTFGTGDDVTVDPVLSGLAGAYSFAGLTAGSYRVSVLVPTGWVLTAGTSPLTVTLADAQQLTSADFGVREVDASISGSAFNDADASRAMNTGEAGVAATSVTLKQSGVVVATRTTAGDGAFSFDGLTAGTFVVEVGAPSGWALTTQSMSTTVTVAAGEANRDIRFGFRVAPSVGDEVFLDVNANGSRDAGEPGVANVLVSLLSGSTVVASTRSDLSGGYLFAAVQLGNYVVSVTAPPGSSVTTAGSSVAVSVSTSAITNVDFGLSGVAFNPGALTTVAGNGANATVDGVGSAAAFKTMGGVAAVGNSVYVFTTGAVRRVDTTSGAVSTLAGSATATGCVDSATAGLVRFSSDVGDVGSDGTYLYVLDRGCTKVRKVALATGATTTLSSSVASPTRMALAPNGFLYVISSSAKSVYKVDTTTGVATLFASLPAPPGDPGPVSGGAIAADADAIWIIVSSSSSAHPTGIARLAITTGTVSWLAIGPAVNGDEVFSRTCCLQGALLSSGDYLYGTTASLDRVVRRWSKADGTFVDVAGTQRWPSSVVPSFSDGVGTDAFMYDGVSGLAYDGVRLWVTDSGNFRIRSITPAGRLSATFDSVAATTTVSPTPAVTWTFAGSGTAATVDGFGATASFSSLKDVVAVGGFVYVAEGSAIRKVNVQTGEISTLVRTTSGYFNCSDSDNPALVKLSRIREMTTDGTYLYVVDSDCHSIRRISLATGATSHVVTYDTTMDAGLKRIAYGPDGYLYAGSGYPSFQSKIFRVNPVTGAFSLLIDFGLPANASISRYAIDNDNLWVMTGSGGGKLWAINLATGVAVQRALPSGIDIDGAALESAGDFLYATTNVERTVVRINKATGVVSNVAGPSTLITGYVDGVGSDARFGSVSAIASDGHGLWVADDGNTRLRLIEDLAVFDQRAASFGFDEYGAWSDDVNVGLGNFTNSATDATVNVNDGPALAVLRTYNSLDPRIGAFGQGWSFNYDMFWTADAAGNVTVVYPDGRREQHTKNTNGSFTPPSGYFSTLAAVGGGGYSLSQKDGEVAAFNSAGQLTQLADGNGRQVNLTYTSGKLATATSVPSGRTLSFTWSSGSRIAQVSTQNVAAYGHALVWTYTYDGVSLKKVCDPRGVTSCSTYSYTVGRLSTVTNPVGNTLVQVHYGVDGKVDWRQDGLAHTTRFLYPSPGVVRSIDARGFATTHEYDLQYHETRATDPTGAVTTFHYDTAGNRDSTTDENSNVTTLTFDARHNITADTDGENHTSYLAYDSMDNVVAVRDARSSGATDNTYKTAMTYDAARNPLTSTTPPTTDFTGGVTTTWTYTNGTQTAIGGGTMPAGLRRTDTDARGGVITYSYDAKGDLRRMVDRAGLQTDYTYDEIGRKLTETVTSDTFPGGVPTSYTYDEVGKVTTVVGPSVTNIVTTIAHQNKTTNTYDGNENLLSTRLEDLTGGDASRTTTYRYDNNDRQTSITDAAGGLLTRVFDPVGNVVLLTDQNGHTTEALYDGRKLAVTVRARNFVDDPIAGSTPHTVTLRSLGYDAGGRVSVDTDALGRQTTFGYDHANRLTATSLVGYHNPDGSTRTVSLDTKTYDAAGNITATTTGGLRNVTNTWDAAGRLAGAVLDPGASPHLNRTTSYSYDANRNPIAVTRTDAATTEQTRYGYDAADRLTATTVENGATDLTTTSTYDQRGVLASTVDPRGNVSGATPTDFERDFGSDALGLLTTITDAPVSVEENGGAATTTRPVTRYGYNAYGNRTDVKDRRGNTTTTVNDRLGRPVTVTYPTYTPPGGGSAVTPTEVSVYDPVGNLVGFTDRRGATTSFDFDNRNRVVRRRDPLVSGQTTRGQIAYSYDDADNRVGVIDQTGAQTTATFDDLNRPRSHTQIVRQPTTTSNVTTFDYDDLNNLIYQRDPVGNETHQTFSVASERVSVTDALGKQTTATYDVASRPTRVTNPLNDATATAYDLAGRPTTTTTYDHTGTPLATATAGWDPVGNQTAFTPPSGYATTETFDAANKLRSVIQPVDGSTSISSSYGYDAAGNPTRTTDGRGNATIVTYQPWNLPQDVIEPSTTAYPNATDRTYTTGYDPGGLPTTVTAPGAVTVTRTFDALKHLTAEIGTQSGQTDASRSFGYDLAGRTTTASNPNGAITFGYDDRGLILSSTGGAGTASFVYDTDGRMTGRADTAGTANYTWTARSQLATETDPLTNTTRSFGWDDAGQLTSTAYTPGGETRGYTYDDRGRLTADNLTNSTNAVLAAASYGYDANNNITAKNTTLTGNSGAGTNSYTYDRADRLTSWTNPSAATATYTWDASGNRSTAGGTSSSYDARNRLTSGPTGSYTYTARGTLQSITNGAVTTNFTFDPLDRLVDYNSQVTYTHDAFDRVATRDSTVFGYDGTELDPVQTGSNTYTHSPAGDVTAVSVGSVSRVAGVDRHGDLAWLLDPGAATVTDTKTFDPFGQSTGTTGSLTPTIGYQSDYTDPTSNLIDMGARWYDPASDTFDSRDTIASNLNQPTTLNRYTYANNSPLNYWDPDGHNFLDDVVGVGKGIVDSAASAAKWVDDNVAQPLADAIGDTANAAVNAAQAGWNTANKAASNTYHFVAAAAGRSYNLIKSNAVHAAAKIRRAAKPALASIHKSVSNLASTLVTGAKTLGKDVSNSTRDARTWIAKNPGLAATIAAGGACLFGVVISCGYALTGAFAIRTAENIEKGRPASTILVDAALTFLPLGLGALGELGAATDEGPELTRVGRWMSAEEHGAMSESGMVQPGRTGVSNVAHPADVEAYMRQAAPGSRYVEFDVPESSLVRGGKEGWATIPGPDSIFSRLKVQRGLAPYEFPAAQNIEWIASRLWTW